MQPVGRHRNIEGNRVAETVGACHSRQIDRRQILQGEPGENGIEAAAHRFAERGAPAIAFGIVQQIGSSNSTFSARVALSRIGREPRILDEGGAGDDLENARCGRSRFDTEIARRPFLDVARPDQNATPCGVEKHDRGLREFVLAENFLRGALQRGIDREVRRAAKRSGCGGVVVVERELVDLDPGERRRWRRLSRLHGRAGSGRRQPRLRLVGAGPVLDQGKNAAIEVAAAMRAIHGRIGGRRRN